jgi:hypothetical protein
MKPDVDERHSTYEKRLATFITCDRFPPGTREVQRQFAANGLYMEFDPDYLMICDYCRSYVMINVNMLLVSTPECDWQGLKYPCTCNKVVRRENQMKKNFIRLWPYYLRYVSNDLLNPKMREIAENGLYPSKFSVTKCFCCKFVVPFLGDKHSRYCIIDKVLKEKFPPGPLCTQCSMMPVTVCSLPCQHKSLCAVCLVTCVKCPAPNCDMNIEYIKFEQ